MVHTVPGAPGYTYIQIHFPFSTSFEKIHGTSYFHTVYRGRESEEFSNIVLRNFLNHIFPEPIKIKYDRNVHIFSRVLIFSHLFCGVFFLGGGGNGVLFGLFV